MILLVSAVALFSWCLGRLTTIYAPKTPVERLKNALLSLALAKACKNDISSDLRYGQYDGTMLPMLAGRDLAHACFTYIMDLTDSRRDPVYTEIIEGKVSAVLRYVDKNLDTDEKVYTFFNRYIEELKSPSQPNVA